MNVRLIVRKSPNKNNLCLIQLRYTHKSENFHHSTGLSIEAANWDSDREVIRKSKRGYTKLNSILLEKKQQVLDIATTMLLNDVDPTVERVKNEVTGKSVKKKIPPLMEFIEQFIEESKAVRKEGTIKTYNTSLKNLKEYQKFKGVILNYEDITLEFYYSYLSFLQKERGNSKGGCSNKIKTLKTFLSRAVDLNYTDNLTFQHKKFITPRNNNAFHIYLTELEVKSMLMVDLSGEKKLQVARDLFLLQCYTALRYGDLFALKPQHFKDDFIHITTCKGEQQLIIPIRPELKPILSRYEDEIGNYRLPKISNTQLNILIKEVGLRSGINEEIIIKKNVKGIMVEAVVPKWQLICTHTGRRTMISQLILKGIDSNIIKKISGHTTDVFMRYVKISNQEAASVVKKVWDKSLDANMRVA